MNASQPMMTLLMALSSVDKSTFADLSASDRTTRFFAARRICDAARSKVNHVAASVMTHMDADALAKASMDPDWKVRRAAQAASLSSARRFARLASLSEEHALQQPLHVCRVMQATNERLKGFANHVIDEWKAGNPVPTSDMPPSFRN